MWASKHVKAANVAMQRRLARCSYVLASGDEFEVEKERYTVYMQISDQKKR